MRAADSSIQKRRLDLCKARPRLARTTFLTDMATSIRERSSPPFISCVENLNALTERPPCWRTQTSYSSNGVNSLDHLYAKIFSERRRNSSLHMNILSGKNLHALIEIFCLDGWPWPVIPSMIRWWIIEHYYCIISASFSLTQPDSNVAAASSRPAGKQIHHALEPAAARPMSMSQPINHLALITSFWYGGATMPFCRPAENDTSFN